VPSAEGATRYDWGRPDDLTPFAADLPSPKSIDLARDIFDGEFDAYSWRQLCAAVRCLGKGGRIVTDRLHGHILAIMMQKQHDLHDNSYGKNSSFYRTWTNTCPLVTFVGRTDSERAHLSVTPSNQVAPAEVYPAVAPEGAEMSRSANLDGQSVNLGDKKRTAQKRIGIVVPYRNREQHLFKFIPHLISYFHREAAKEITDFKIIIVEQDDDLPFNRGGLLNAGFLAVADLVDYVCFHDVDYLPMWADYSYAASPTRIIWWGMHARPIRVNDLTRRTAAPLTGLGAVTLFSNEQFRRVNGYSNRFFGWGFEDKDLAARCSLHSLTIAQRDGTFIPLDHDNAGFLADGSKSPAWLENEQRYADNQRQYALHGTGHEGLSNFSAHMSPIERARVSGLDDAETADVMHLLVNFGEPQAVKRQGIGTLRLFKTAPTIAPLSEGVINADKEPSSKTASPLTSVGRVPTAGV
jgi:hypothetical protein